MIHIVGIGNEFRRDDGVGPFVSELVQKRVKALSISGVVCRSYSDSLLDLFEIFLPDETVILIDAVVTGGAVSDDHCARKKTPGQIYYFDLLKNPPEAQSIRFSSHAFDPLQTAGFALELGQKPKTLMLYAIEAGDFTHGQGLTSAVEEAARHVARQIIEEFCWCDIELDF